MLRVHEEELIGTKEELITYYEIILTKLYEEDHIEMINDILNEVKSSNKDQITVFFHPMDNAFHIKQED